jgi:hypothetical protein
VILSSVPLFLQVLTNLQSISLIFRSDLQDEKLEGERDRHRRHEHGNGQERKGSAD